LRLFPLFFGFVHRLRGTLIFGLCISATLLECRLAQLGWVSRCQQLAMGVSQPCHHRPPSLTFAVLLCDLLKLFSPDVDLEVLIKLIPIMPVTMAMPVVLSPKMLPFIIINAPAKQRETPKADSTRCQVLVFLFNFYTSLFIPNFMLSIFNTKLDIYNITLFKSCCRTKIGKRLSIDATRKKWFTSFCKETVS
jgi:hypothetical protein